MHILVWGVQQLNYISVCFYFGVVFFFSLNFYFRMLLFRMNTFHSNHEFGQRITLGPCSETRGRQTLEKNMRYTHEICDGNDSRRARASRNESCGASCKQNYPDRDRPSMMGMGEGGWALCTDQSRRRQPGRRRQRRGWHLAAW